MWRRPISQKNSKLDSVYLQVCTRSLNFQVLLWTLAQQLFHRIITSDLNSITTAVIDERSTSKLKFTCSPLSSDCQQWHETAIKIRLHSINVATLIKLLLWPTLTKSKSKLDGPSDLPILGSSEVYNRAMSAVYMAESSFKKNSAIDILVLVKRQNWG